MGSIQYWTDGERTVFVGGSGVPVAVAKMVVVMMLVVLLLTGEGEQEEEEEEGGGPQQQPANSVGSLTSARPLNDSFLQTSPCVLLAWLQKPCKEKAL